MPGPRNPIRDIDQQIIKKLLNDGWKNQDILALVNNNRRIFGYNDLNNGRISDIKSNKDKRFNLSPASDKELRIYKRQIEDKNLIKKGYITKMLNHVQEELPYWQDCGVNSNIFYMNELIEEIYDKKDELNQKILSLGNEFENFGNTLDDPDDKLNPETLEILRTVDI